MRPARSAAAAALGTYPRRSAAARTRDRVASDTRPRSTSLSTWLTVARETPASRATSALVTGRMRTGWHKASARDDRCPDCRTGLLLSPALVGDVGAQPPIALAIMLARVVGWLGPPSRRHPPPASRSAARSKRRSEDPVLGFRRTGCLISVQLAAADGSSKSQSPSEESGCLLLGTSFWYEALYCHARRARRGCHVSRRPLRPTLPHRPRCR